MSLTFLDQREVGLKVPWLVISFKLYPCDQYACGQNTDIDFHTPLIPLHWTFHPWSSKEALGNIQRNAWHFLFTQPIWCLAGNRQFALCGTSSISLPSGAGSSRVVMVILASLACTTIHRGVPSVGAMRKTVSGGLMSILSAGSSSGRKGHLQQPGTTLHTAPPPTNPSLSSCPCRHQL